MLAYHFEGVPRSPLGIALKNVLTLGIHTKVWLYRINREMDGHEGFHIDLRWLGVMVTLPIITPIVVKFQTARRLNQMVSHQVTLPLVRASRLGWLSLIPVLGAGFYAYWVQDSLNRHWFHHRREERLRLAKDRLAALDERLAGAEAGDPVLENKRSRLNADVEAWEAEIAEEVEAARIRWGDERFADRKKRADLHATAGARMSRKEIAALRAEEKRHRKEEKARRKAARGRWFGLLPPKDDEATPDVDDDSQWQPKTPAPERTPDEIRLAAEHENRELSAEEEKELKRAERQVAKREKESLRIEKRRADLRARLEKERSKREAAEEKARQKAERVAAKAEKKAASKQKTQKTKKPGRKGRGKKRSGPEAEPIPVDVKPRTLRAPPTVHDAGEGPLRLLTVRCPRCRTEIQDVRKRGDAPAKITCPTCQLVGKL